MSLLHKERRITLLSDDLLNNSPALQEPAGKCSPEYCNDKNSFPPGVNCSIDALHLDNVFISDNADYEADIRGLDEELELARQYLTASPLSRDSLPAVDHQALTGVFSEAGNAEISPICHGKYRLFCQDAEQADIHLLTGSHRVTDGAIRSSLAESINATAMPVEHKKSSASLLRELLNTDICTRQMKEI